MTVPLIDIPYPFAAETFLAAGQPDEQTLRAARDVGYTMVVNLRTEGEFDEYDERAVVESLGMAYRQIPVAGAAGVTDSNARALQAALLEAAPGSALVHCGTANRVGALVALFTSLEGADAETALSAGKRTGLAGLEPVVRMLLEQRSPS